MEDKLKVGFLAGFGSALIAAILMFSAGEGWQLGKCEEEHNVHKCKMISVPVEPTTPQKEAK